MLLSPAKTKPLMSPSHNKRRKLDDDESSLSWASFESRNPSEKWEELLAKEYEEQRKLIDIAQQFEKWLKQPKMFSEAAIRNKLFCIKNQHLLRSMKNP